MQGSSLRSIDRIRREISQLLDPGRRSRMGQFMTPSPVADFMASLFTRWPASVRLLDPGAGVGSLTEAFARQFAVHAPAGASLEVHCFEIEPLLGKHLAAQLRELERAAAENGKSFNGIIHDDDFVSTASFELGFGKRNFTHAILNPPYRKINSDSEYRRLLRLAGIETVNLYTAFLGLAVAMVEDGGEIVAVIPRSFCNGAYFRPFRKFLFERAAVTHIHAFESRIQAFKDDDVLQENIIIRLVRAAVPGQVIVSTSTGVPPGDFRQRTVPFVDIVKPGDAELFIHIPTTEVNGSAGLFECSLTDLGLEVSTGPVVDFRVRDHWLSAPSADCVPLLYAHHFKRGTLNWPADHRKPNALALNDETRKWSLPRGCYTLIKRFSSKEERRRLVAYVIEPDDLAFDLYGFENHLNVIHVRKQGISPNLAHGLALFLNSTVVDRHFRNFSGHTQVNATDLRTMRYPNRMKLEKFGCWARGRKKLTQEAIDRYIERERGNDKEEAH